jgi:hypothetical protein
VLEGDKCLEKNNQRKGSGGPVLGDIAICKKATRKVFVSADAKERKRRDTAVSES